MKVKHLRTVGDGFCFNHHWPMWSQLLAEILDCDWKNFSLPGMGNEAISNIVVDQLDAESLTDVLWVIQWAEPNRVDLRADFFGPKRLKEIESDPVYYKNFITTAQGRRYWCSGASKLPWIAEHRDFIDLRQGHDRKRLYQLAVTQALQNAGAKWIFISTRQMMDFLPISKYHELDVGEIQPVSSVHLDFLEHFVLPGLEINTHRLEKIQQKVLSDDQQRKSTNQHIPENRNIHK